MGFNPRFTGKPIKFPQSVSHYRLSKRYRSAQTITELADCVSKHLGMEENYQGDLGTDVPGQRVTVFDLGKLTDPAVMATALENIGDMLDGEGRQEIALLYDNWDIRGKEWVEALQSPRWTLAPVREYFGAESDTVVSVGAGGYSMEAITRAK